MSRGRTRKRRVSTLHPVSSMVELLVGGENCLATEGYLTLYIPLCSERCLRRMPKSVEAVTKYLVYQILLTHHQEILKVEYNQTRNMGNLTNDEHIIT